MTKQTSIKYLDPNLGKFAMPIQYYQNIKYPPYVIGPAYVLSADIRSELINTIDKYRGNVLVIEDVFITGIISEISSVERHHSDSFKLIGCNNVCAFHDSIAVFMCKDINQMKRFWRNWIKSSPERCEKTNTWINYLRFIMNYTRITI